MHTINEYTVKQFEGMERHEPVVLDNSALTQYKKCPLSYFYRYVLGYTVKETPAYFPFGTAYHKFREVLETEYQSRRKASNNILECGSLAFLKAITEAKSCFEKASVGVDLDASYGKYAYLTWERLAVSCEMVFQYWLKEKQAGNIIVLSSEQPFSVCIGTINGTDIFMGGRADEIILWNDKLHGRDFKTTTTQARYYQKGINPNSQFAFYTFAESELHGQQVKGQLVEVLFNQKTTKPEIRAFPTSFVREQLSRWREDTLFWMEQIIRSRETDHYPQNESSCYMCPFHSVCVMPTDNSRMTVLKNQYQKKLWDYMNPEG